jgi:thermitase
MRLVSAHSLFCVLIITLLLTSLLSVTLNHKPNELESKPLTDSLYGLKDNSLSQRTEDVANRKLADPYKLEDQEANDFSWNSDKLARLVVETDTTEPQLKTLKEQISLMNGNITETLSTSENSHFLVINLPKEQVPIFTKELQNNNHVKNIEPNHKVKALHIPNDPHWPDQWGPTKIQATLAWDTILGSSDILVAIIDTGIDYTHAELAENYVPLGYDWANNDTDPIDDNGHGTHCAGVVAAKIDNNIGIAGLAQVRVMAEKVLGSAGWGWDSWVAGGIIHATDSGAKIISMSLGGPDWSDVMHEAVEYASAHGVLIMASAGNTATPSPHYPAAYEEVIAVSATDESDNLAWFSTFGEWIDLSAPGVDIYSTVLGNSYKYLSGTSMACPHVAGVAALAWSKYPNCTADQIRWVLEHTADDLGYEGFDESFGYGRVNAKKAVSLPEHDLCIAECKYPRRVDPAQQCKFNVTIANYGTRNETNISVKFYVNDALTSSLGLSLLKTFSSEVFTFSWSTTVTGNYRIKFQVTPVPGESLTENNVAYYDLSVRFPSTLRVPSEYPTIQIAVGCSGSGDKVLVKEGYYEEGQIDIFSDNVTLVADGIVFLDGFGGYCAINVRADFVTVEGFDIANCSAYGVKIRGHCNTIRNNYILYNRDSLRLYDSSGCVISQNYIRPASGGIIIERSWNNTFSQNRIVSNSFDGGINLRYSSNNTITMNSIRGVLMYALEIYCSSNNVISMNELVGNRFGLVLRSSAFNILRDNTMVSNWCNFAPETGPLAYSWAAPNDVDASNTVDGRPICYWVNVSNRAVPSDAGCVVLVNCVNITVENLELKNNFDGILLVNSSNILIRHNNIRDNWNNYERYNAGILSDAYSSSITIVGNNITANLIGISLSGSNNNVSLNNIANNFNEGVIMSQGNVLSRNNITGNQGAGALVAGFGCIIEFNNMMSNLASNLHVTGLNCTIVSNNLIGNGRPIENIYGTSHYGLTLCASNCTIRDNNIIGCDDYGIWALNAFGNKIFHNNIINNTVTFYSPYGSSSNIWDDDYPSGGNYWSSYSGTDGNGDGIGDTPYILDVNNTDRYPLMVPWTGNPPPQICTLIIDGTIDSSPIEGFYNTPLPRPGTYFFMTESAIRVSTRLMYPVFVDHWVLNGTGIGPGDSLMLMMDKSYHLTAFFSVVPPLSISISPLTAKIRLGNSTIFTSSVSGGKPPYEYLWLVDGREVWNATSSTWTFVPKKFGTYSIQLMVRYPFTESYIAIFYQSETVSLTVLIPGDTDADFDVDIYDVVRICAAYGSKRGEPPYDPVCDMNDDGKINIYDVVTATANYGQKWP